MAERLQKDEAKEKERLDKEKAKRRGGKKRVPFDFEKVRRSPFFFFRVHISDSLNACRRSQRSRLR